MPELPSDDRLLKPCPEGQISVKDPAVSNTSCHCRQGYQGSACNQDIDECSVGSNPCEYGGRCINSLGSYRCQCLLGFMGSHCELDVNQCASGPCKNNATCLNLIGKYKCICKSGFVGPQCQGVVCGQQVCQNGGTCLTTRGGNFCRCVNGWTGDDCSENIDDCQDAACSEGSTCRDRVGSFSCICPPGRTGENLFVCSCVYSRCVDLSTGTETPLDVGCVCLSGANPCEHGGACINTVGSFSCECQAGYVGPRCERDINECASNPCQNNAICLDQIGQYKCICEPGRLCLHL
ncbi:neurogenic locus notch homolog protein 1-like [Clupea harengus]|uniref:Neurogenic locus notch homolog protein 1-like n=1 Tax=Clupea harengus TaxID=7950 RepID=A0A8M1KHA8_CLUHA|nr:neurogenic locus notch homolog protein 1-like [Clupea harengus]